MRFLLAFLMIALIANPAWSAFNGPSAAHKEIVSVVAALESAEGSTCVLTGNILEHVNGDRYTFRDNSGSITVKIPQHVFGSLNVTPENTVRITGEIRGKREPHRPDTHLGVRYIEVIN